MGAAAAPLAIAGSIGSGVMGAASAYEQGQATNAADQAQAARLQRAAEIGKAQAAETDAQMRDRLNLTLGNIDAVRAASGADPSSPTTAALRGRTEQLGDMERGIRVGNITAQSEQDTADSNYASAAGSFAMKMGAFGAASSILGSVGKTNWGAFGAGGPGSGPPNLPFYAPDDL